MAEIVEYNLEIQKRNKRTKVRIYTNSSSHWRRMDDVNPKPLDKIIIEGKQEMIKDLEKFLSDKDWYEERSILYKRGYLFHGKPGNGKTSLAMSIAKRFERDLYIFNPARITDQELTSLYSEISTNCILVVEDIDAVFNKDREKEDDSIKFNFSTLLNCLDGAFSKEGIITIFTTNHPERLDPALIRAGRMDYEFKISNPSIEKIEEYLNIFFPKNKTSLRYEGTNETLPMVKIQDICIRNKNNYQKALDEINVNINEKTLIQS